MDFYFENTNLSDRSKKMYSQSVDKWIQFMPSKYQSVEYIISNPKIAYNCLINSLQTNTPENRHIYLSGAMAVVRHCPDICKKIKNLDNLKLQWEKLIKDNSQPIIERRLENKPTPMQQLKGGSDITLHEVQQKRLSLEKGSMSRLLLSMYILIPPVRADYHSAQIVYPGDKINYPNYIIIDNTNIKLVITEYKTAKIYGQIVHEKLPKELHDEIILSLQKQPRQFLFTNAQNKPYTRDAFSKWSSRLLEKIFDTDMTLTLIRHLYISSLDFNKMTTKELDKISKHMGHSLNMQSQYRWNNADDE